MRQRKTERGDRPMNDDAASPIKNWQHLERLAAALQEKLDPGAQVVGSQYYRGRLNGGRRQVDASVFGRLGSAKIWIAIDAKHLGEKVDLPDVEKFAALLRDVGANKGIMVTLIGYTPAALEAGARECIDTCVFRPARDEDWENQIRSFHTRVVLAGIDFDDKGTTVRLADGRVIAANHLTMFRDRDGDFVGLPELVESHINRGVQEEWLDGASFRMGFPSGALALLLSDDDEPNVNELTCQGVHRTESDAIEMLVQDPRDFVYLKMLPNEQIEERRLFEFSDLDRSAERFKP